jgi:microcystin-dependent protein
VTQPFLGEIRLFPLNFAPKNWAMANGQLLSIQQNAALFSLLGTQYGGNGVSTFALPDLRGRVAEHQTNTGDMGVTGGVEAVALTTNQMPQHTHQLQGTTTQGNSAKPFDKLMGGAATAANHQAYAPATNLTPLLAASIQPNGSGVGHDNLQPYLVLNYCIALAGVFPSRN